jgi:hypothetical protein
MRQLLLAIIITFQNEADILHSRIVRHRVFHNRILCNKYFFIEHLFGKLAVAAKIVLLKEYDSVEGHSKYEIYAEPN